MLYNCTHMTTVGVKGLTPGFSGSQSAALDNVYNHADWVVVRRPGFMTTNRT